MEKYDESTPLADRDEYQAWKKQHDEEEAKSSKDKYGKELNSRNDKIYQAWRHLIATIRDHGFNSWYSGSEGFDEFLNDKEPYLCPTGYFNSLSFNTEGLDFGSVAEERLGGMGIAIWYKTEVPGGREAGGDVFEEFIPNLKKARGAEFAIIATTPIYENSEMTYGMKSEKQQLNLYTKSLIEEGYTRSEISDVIKAYQDFIDGDTEKYAPGSTHAVYSGLEEDRPCVIAFYDIPLIPDLDDDETYNVVRCVENFYNTFVKPFE